MVFDAILSGLLSGLVLSAIALGPSFFLIMETSINKGWKSAIILDSGIIASDALCMIAAYYGASSLIEGLEDSLLLYVVGGAIFFGYGLFKYIKRGYKSKNVTNLKQEGAFKSFITGFAVNLINPGVIFYWLTVVSIGVNNYAKTGNPGLMNLTFNLSILGAIFAVDLLKIYFANLLKKVLKPKALYHIETITSIIFMLIGIGIVAKSIFEHMPIKLN